MRSCSEPAFYTWSFKSKPSICEEAVALATAPAYKVSVRNHRKPDFSDTLGTILWMLKARFVGGGGWLFVLTKNCARFFLHYQRCSNNTGQYFVFGISIVRIDVLYFAR